MNQTKELSFKPSVKYQTLVLWHEKLAKRNKLLISLLLIPCLFYYFSKNSISIVVGLIYIACVLGSAKTHEKKLRQEATRMDSLCLSNIHKKIAQIVPVSENVTMTFGYLVSDDVFQCVSLIKNGNEIVMLDNTLVLNYVYGNHDGTVLCMVAINDDAFLSHPVVLPDITDASSLCSENHQTILRQEAVKKNTYLIMESFMYEKVYRQMCVGKTKQLMHITYELSKMKKEKIYQLPLENEMILFIPTSNLLHLS